MVSKRVSSSSAGPIFHDVMTRRRGASFTLRCFDCDWGLYVRDADVARDAQAEHATEPDGAIDLRRPALHWLE